MVAPPSAWAITTTWTRSRTISTSIRFKCTPRKKTRRVVLDELAANSQKIFMPSSKTKQMSIGKRMRTLSPSKGRRRFPDDAYPRDDIDDATYHAAHTLFLLCRKTRPPTSQSNTTMTVRLHGRTTARRAPRRLPLGTLE
jgi:hypothetical protein